MKLLFATAAHVFNDARSLTIYFEPKDQSTELVVRKHPPGKKIKTTNVVFVAVDPECGEGDRDAAAPL